MEKAAADSILERDTGPIEPHLEALATSREIPAYAVGMCTLRIEKAAPALRAVVERAAAGNELSFDEGTLLLRGLYILGGARDQASFQPFLRLLRRPSEELDRLLGDVVTDGAQRIAAGTFDGDTEALLACVSDSGVDEFVRHALLGTATFLTWNGKIDRDRFRRFLVDFHDGRLAEDGAYVWIAWLMAIGLLGLRDLAPMVKTAWDDGRVPEGIMEWRHFEQELRDAERAPDDIERFHGNELGYIEDALEAMKWTAIEDEAPSSSIERSPGRGYVHDQPIINPNRGLGRNDPCPCGSGKKYKKCCLGT